VKLFLDPNVSQVTPETGIGQVVIAQAKHLPKFGIKLVDRPEAADVIACHVGMRGNSRIDVLHCHGLYFDDIKHVPYSSWHNSANKEIAKSARSAYAVTVPSSWVSMPFLRDMRLKPVVLGHGVDVDLWPPGENGGYALWNKNRNDDVCNPLPAYQMARAGVPVFSTYAPKGTNTPDNMYITGRIPFRQMKSVIAKADVYLATTIETGTIGILEAMACGVPVIGYNWGATIDLVNGENGILVKPNDIEALVEAYETVTKNRSYYSDNARATAEEHTWEKAIQSYVPVYEKALQDRKSDKGRVSFVIPAYNYAKYLPECLNSILKQKEPAHEIIVVDDGSTDNTEEVVRPYIEKGVTYIHKKNSGVAATRNLGIEKATGEFIVCLDADDMVHQQFSSVLAKALKEDRYLGVAYSGILMFSEEGKPITPTMKPFDWELMTQPKSPPPNCIPSGSMFRRSMWEHCGGYYQSYAPAEDTEFWVRGLSTGYEAELITKDALFFYRVHDGSASRTLKYETIDTWHPWMRDKIYPFAAPNLTHAKIVNAYAFPSVSVVIPVGPGHGKWLPSALNSLLGQTMRHWEAVVVDDTGENETDGIEVVYPFVKVIKTRGRTGAGAARNRGVKAASAPLIFFLDADDFISPNTLEKMLRLYAHHEGKYYIYTGWVGLEGAATKLKQCNEYNAEMWINDPEKSNAINMLMAKEDVLKVGGFDEKLKTFEDIDFVMKCATIGVHGMCLDEPLYYYRLETGQRRPESIDELKEFDAKLREKYRGVKMSKCCGGNADAFIAAKNAILGIKVAKTKDPTKPEVKNMSTNVRMEFIGSEKGAQRFFGKYRGGNNNTNKFDDVSPADVAMMEATGKWKTVERPVMPDDLTLEFEQAKAPAPEKVVKSSVEIQEAANARIMAAKLEFQARIEKEVVLEAEVVNVEVKEPELEEMKMYELKEIADQLKLEYKGNCRKDDLIDMIRDAWASTA